MIGIFAPSIEQARYWAQDVGLVPVHGQSARQAEAAGVLYLSPLAANRGRGAVLDALVVLDDDHPEIFDADEVRNALLPALSTKYFYRVRRETLS